MKTSTVIPVVDGDGTIRYCIDGAGLLRRAEDSGFGLGGGKVVKGPPAGFSRGRLAYCKQGHDLLGHGVTYFQVGSGGDVLRRNERDGTWDVIDPSPAFDPALNETVPYEEAEE